MSPESESESESGPASDGLADTDRPAPLFA